MFIFFKVYFHSTFVCVRYSNAKFPKFNRYIFKIFLGNLKCLLNFSRTKINKPKKRQVCDVIHRCSMFTSINFVLFLIYGTRSFKHDDLRSMFCLISRDLVTNLMKFHLITINGSLTKIKQVVFHLPSTSFFDYFM